MNMQTKTNQDKEKSLVYNHDKARVLVTVITTFNKHVEHVVEEHRQQHVVTYGLKAGDKAATSCFRPVHKHLLNNFEKQRAMESLLFLTEKGTNN